jgi:hypothetical protein
VLGEFEMRPYVKWSKRGPHGRKFKTSDASVKLLPEGAVSFGWPMESGSLASVSDSSHQSWAISVGEQWLQQG